MSTTTARYEDGLRQALLDPAEAAAYLDAALSEGDMDGFLLALRDVAEARDMTQATLTTKLNRENLYPILGSNGNPQLSSLNTLLHSLGLRLAVEINTPAMG